MRTIGVTGTRNMTALTTEQLKFFSMYLISIANEHKEVTLHHGGCPYGGADLVAHEHALQLGWQVVIHPMNMTGSQLEEFTIRYRITPMVKVLEPHPPLDRNHHLVLASHEMIGLPGTVQEQFRGSGTWATIRYSHKIQKPMNIFFPDGSRTYAL